MSQWMAVLTFKAPPDQAVMALIPTEQTHVAELMAKHIIEARYLAADNSVVWLVLNGDTHQAIEETLAMLPMYTLFTIQITLLR